MNWYFAPVTAEFSQHKDVRLFKIYKEIDGRIVIKYKTNCLKKHWKEFINSDDNLKYGIQVYTSYLSTFPTFLIPKQLLSEILESIVTNSTYKECLKTKNFNFWLNLKNDSISYLEVKEPLPFESKLIIILK